MKLYIACDAEGISGVSRRPDEIPEIRTMMTRDVNAAVAGARAGGATDIVVWDMHDGGKTLLYEELEDGAEYIQGSPPIQRLPGLDASFAGVFFIGYHAMGGTAHAVCDHTMSSTNWQQLWINGREIGEIGLDALWAGRFDVPVLLISGDDKACAEAWSLLGKVETVQVKMGLGRHAARMLAPKAARQSIYEGAQAAIANAGGVQPFKIDPPYELKLRYTSSHHLDGVLFDGKRRERLDGQTVVYRTNDLVEALTRQV